MPHVMAVASAGGHWVQLMRLVPAWQGCRLSYVTTDPGLHEVARNAAAALGAPVPGFHAVTSATRWQKLHLVLQMLQVAVLVLRLRPDVIVTTGASPGYFALRIGRFLGAYTIWIDSMANAERLSLSGERIGPHADLWLTQWEHLARPGGPQYLGAVL